MDVQTGEFNFVKLSTSKCVFGFLVPFSKLAILRSTDLQNSVGNI